MDRQRYVAGKPIINLIEKGWKIPFDVRGIRTIIFSLDNQKGIEKKKNELREQIRNAEEGKVGIVECISALLAEIPLHALEYLVSKGKAEDHSEEKFGKEAYRNKIIINLDYSNSTGDELLIENVDASRIDASSANLKNLSIRNSRIVLLDISNAIIEKLTIDDATIHIMDRSKSEIGLLERRKARVAYTDSWKSEVKSY